MQCSSARTEDKWGTPGDPNTANGVEESGIHNSRRTFFFNIRTAGYVDNKVTYIM